MATSGDVRENAILAGGLVVALVATAVVSAVTTSAAVLGVTPLGIALFLVLGIAAPQSLLARTEGDRERLVFAALAVVAGVAVLLAGAARGVSAGTSALAGINRVWDLGFYAALAGLGIVFLVVVGFWRGYRQGAGTAE